MLQSILALLKFLPMLMELASKIEEWVKIGVEKREIESALKKIDLAFAQTKNPSERARKLNDVFRQE